MATYFGEVLALSSRAVMDEEDEVDESPQYELLLEKSENFESKKCKLGVFSFSEAANSFIKNYFQTNGSKLLATVKSRYVKDDDGEILVSTGLKRPKASQMAAVYSDNADAVFCHIKHSLPEDLSFDMCRILIEAFPIDEALVLTTCPSVTYKTADSGELQDFVKALATGAYLNKNKCNIPLLPLPNILTNFPAALLSEFEVSDKPALGIVSYVNSSHFDSINVKAFEPILQEKIVIDNLCVNDDAVPRMEQDMKHENVSYSNLYA